MQSNTAESRYLKYKPGARGQFNAWWILEKIEYPSKANRLQRGDMVVRNGIYYVVVGWDREDDPILESDAGDRSCIPSSAEVTIAATRSEIGAHGQRLGYSGSEVVFDRS